MKTRVIRRDGGLLIPVPEEVATATQLEEDAEVDVSAFGEDVLVSTRQKPTLEDLVAAITEENRHDEIEWGPPVGREVW